MNPLKQYNIGFIGLSEGKHSFSFDLADDFFACFKESELEHGHVHLDLTLEKTSTMLVLEFKFKGEVDVDCDRCMEPFPMHVESEKRLFVKFGEEFSEQSDEIIIISSTESHFDISQYVYEFLHLSMPARRVHPDDASGNIGCDPEQIKKLDEYLWNKNKQKADQSPWEVLKSLNFKNNNKKNP